LAQDTGVKRKGPWNPKAVKAEDLLFLLAHVAWLNFSDVAERRRRVAVSFATLAGRDEPTVSDYLLVDGELRRCDARK
jgi:hypothetical protein